MKKIVILVAMILVGFNAFGQYTDAENLGKISIETIHDIRGDKSIIKVCMITGYAYVYIQKTSFLDSTTYCIYVSSKICYLGTGTIYLKVDDTVYAFNNDDFYPSNSTRSTILWANLDQNLFLKIVNSDSIQIQYGRRGEPETIDKVIMDKVREAFL